MRFVVSDSGIGLSDEQQSHVFDSFSQVDGSIRRAYEGAGLGLAMCRQMVALMGGSLWVESVPGAGSTFTCHLPQRLTDTTAPHRGNPRASASDEHRRVQGTSPASLTPRAG